MTGATIDHLVSITIFLGAILVFISLFNQLIQTAILYQRHRHLATKCSDLLDNILLNTGHPLYWGRSNYTPTSFGLQDPEFTQYRLSPFSVMRLRSSIGDLVYYSKTGSYYSNLTVTFGNFLLVPFNEVINHSTASRLLGINGTYGFQLSITPTVTVSISEIQSNPLKLALDVTGTGTPLSNAAISYSLLTVEATGSDPHYSIESGTARTDDTGSVVLNFSDVNGATESYTLITYAHLSGITGAGYYSNAINYENRAVPLVSNFKEGEVILAHSYDIYGGQNPGAIKYNTTFVLVTDDFTLREMPLENSSGLINYGKGKPYGVVKIPTYTPGILIVTYRKSAVQFGAVLMPWGISTMAFPVTFGEDPFGHEWVATDTRQVIINKIAYRAQFSLWGLQSRGMEG